VDDLNDTESYHPEMMSVVVAYCGIDCGIVVPCLKNVPTFTVSVTLSNLNWFSKCLHCWKAYEICYKTHTTISTSP